jgi:hypothetical protein
MSRSTDEQVRACLTDMLNEDSASSSAESSSGAFTILLNLPKPVLNDSLVLTLSLKLRLNHFTYPRSNSPYRMEGVDPTINGL